MLLVLEVIVTNLKRININLQEIIDKYEVRNKSRIKRLETEEKVEIRLMLLSLHNETLEIIKDLKKIK